MKKNLLFLLFFALLATAASAQNTVFAERDSVFIRSADGQIKVPISSTEISTRIAEAQKKRADLDELVALYQRIASMREQAVRLREEEDALTNLLGEVRDAEAKITKK